MAIRHPTIKKMITELRRLDKFSYGIHSYSKEEETLDKLYDKIVKLRSKMYNDWVSGKIIL
jgi:hypothetical protein